MLKSNQAHQLMNPYYLRLKVIQQLLHQFRLEKRFQARASVARDEVS